MCAKGTECHEVYVKDNIQLAGGYAKQNPDRLRQNHIVKLILLIKKIIYVFAYKKQSLSCTC